MNNINIFVSSTCYDLSQIRKDISEFILNLGHVPILSEFENFPISPELNTIENCIKIVNENADILVLIVGNRYGSIIENGKSITNNEFLVAKQKGIPIFCFIDKSTLNALNFWKNNKNGNFSNVVDNIQIFEFIEEIRNNSRIWTFPFENAQEIIRTLKIQLSYLFKNSLKAKKVFDEEIPEFFKLNLSARALKILIEKNDLFEYHFLAQVLVDEIQKKDFLRNDIEYSILTEPKHIINDVNEIPEWAQERLYTAFNIVDGLSSIVNVALPKFFNEPGFPSDLKGLYYVSIKYAEVYEKLLNWMIETKSTYLSSEFQHIKNDLSEIVLNPAKRIWDFPFNFYKEINLAHDKLLLGDNNLKINVGLTLEIDDKVIEKINTDLQQLKEYYGI